MPSVSTTVTDSLSSDRVLADDLDILLRQKVTMSAGLAWVAPGGEGTYETSPHRSSRMLWPRVRVGKEERDKECALGAPPGAGCITLADCFYCEVVVVTDHGLDDE